MQFIINTYKPTGAVLKELVKESKHPYDDSSNIEDCISIPGATKLRIEFDP